MRADAVVQFLRQALALDGSVNIAWMSQLAYLDTANSLPQLDTRAMASMMYRDPTPLFDLLPEAWQRQLTTVPR